MSKDINIGRHKRQCTICRHENLADMEDAFVGWRSPASIAEEYRLADRASVYRHAHAFNLFAKRQKNVRSALEKIIEKVCDVEVTAASVVSAIQAYTKINAAGEWVEKVETVSLNDLFDRMTAVELETYATTGVLPGWFRSPLSATSSNSQETVR